MVMEEKRPRDKWIKGVEESVKREDWTGAMVEKL